MNSSDKAKVRAIADANGGIAPRLPFPQACLDGAFILCLEEALQTPELIENFDRLYGASLCGRQTPIERMVDKATGKLQEDVQAFARFVHDSVYMRLDDEAIFALRVTHLNRQDEPVVLHSDSGP